MLKAVIDTNVFISGLLKSPINRSIIRELENSTFIFVISVAIFNEIIDVLARPKFHGLITKESAQKLIEIIKTQALFVRPSEKVNIIKEDPDDNCFLEAAITAKVDFIISEDKHLLNLKIFQKISIIKPNEFLKRVRIK